MGEIKNDDVNLYDSLITLWDAKLTIGIFLIISLLFGAGVVLMETPVYKSDIQIKNVNYYKFSTFKKNVLDFEKIYYSKKTFADWKRKNNASINFEDFSRELPVNRFVVSKTTPGVADLILSKKKLKLVVTSSQLSVADEFYNYASYVNSLLKPGLLEDANRQLKVLEKRYQGISASNAVIVDKFMFIDTYISKLHDGLKVFEIMLPTSPVKISPKPFQVFTIFLIIGLIIGILFVLLRNSIRLKNNPS